MNYMTLKQASDKWGISPRMINYYCSEGRIPGAENMGRVWLIPTDAEKPTDKRYKSFKTRIDAEQKAVTEQGEIAYEKNFDR